MTTKRFAAQLGVVAEAKRQLRCVPIPWYQIDRAAYEVPKDHPSASDRELVALIVAAALEEWSLGMDCC